MTNNTNSKVEALRQAVLESWTLTYQREARRGEDLERAEEKRRVFFTRYAGLRKKHPREVMVEYKERTYWMFAPVPEERAWLPFAVLLEQFEAAVREEERR